jgi:hypothetical protein
MRCLLQLITLLNIKSHPFIFSFLFIFPPNNILTHTQYSYLQSPLNHIITYMGWLAIDNSKIVQNHSMGLETHFCTQTQCYMSLVWSYNACHHDLEVYIFYGLSLEVFEVSARFSFLYGSLWEVKICFPTRFNNKVTTFCF